MNIENPENTNERNEKNDRIESRKSSTAHSEDKELLNNSVSEKNDDLD